MAAHSGRFIQRYTQDADFRNGIDGAWGDQAYPPIKRVDYLSNPTRIGIHTSYGDAAVPRMCTGVRRALFGSRHNAAAAGALCCSKFKNGQMGSNVDEGGADEAEICGFAWTGAPTAMTHEEVNNPQPPPVAAGRGAANRAAAAANPDQEGRQRGDMEAQINAREERRRLYEEGRYGRITPANRRREEARIRNRNAGLPQGLWGHVAQIVGAVPEARAAAPGARAAAPGARAAPGVRAHVGPAQGPLNGRPRNDDPALGAQAPRPPPPPPPPASGALNPDAPAWYPPGQSGARRKSYKRRKTYKKRKTYRR